MDLDGLEGQLYMFTVLNPLLVLDLLFLECGNPWHHELRCVAGFNSLLSPLFYLLQLREAKGEQIVLPLVRLLFPSASGGLWALGCVWERRLYARRCRLDPSSSRFRFLAAVSRWQRRRCLGIRSSRALPCLDGASLRRRRRVCGGGFPQVDPLFRSLWTVARRQVSLLVFCSVDLGQAVGFVDARWLDLAWLPLGDGGRRWRVRIWELEELGCGPGR